MSEGSSSLCDDPEAPHGAQPSQHPTVRDAELETLRLQNLRLRDELIGSEMKLGELRERVQRLEARCRRTEDLCSLRLAHVENELALGAMYQEQVQQMLASTTWRIGRAIVRPSSIAKRAIRPR